LVQSPSSSSQSWSHFIVLHDAFIELRTIKMCPCVGQQCICILSPFLSCACDPAPSRSSPFVSVSLLASPAPAASNSFDHPPTRVHNRLECWRGHGWEGRKGDVRTGTWCRLPQIGGTDRSNLHLRRGGSELYRYRE
jgi:hypothetical protein